MTSNYKEWSRLVTKEACGIDDSHFGKVKDVEPDYVITERGTTDKERFYIPKQRVQGYDNKKVIFRITEEEARTLYLNKEIVVRKVLKTENVNSQRIRRPKRGQ
jgi:ferredoxin-fold anticodon binding domain-containing protein